MRDYEIPEAEGYDSHGRRRAIPIWVSGEYRLCPGGWWRSLRGPKPPFTWRESNGCSYSPDVLPVSDFALWPACVIHDWHYNHGDAFHLSRLRSDWILSKNIWTLMRLQDAGIVHSAAVAGLYFQGVRRFGGPFWKECRG